MFNIVKSVYVQRTEKNKCHHPQPLNIFNIVVMCQWQFTVWDHWIVVGQCVNIENKSVMIKELLTILLETELSICCVLYVYE